MAGKQVTELPKIQNSKLTDLLMVHDGYGLKAISVEDFNSCVSDNAGAHNSIFRGKYLGERVTDEQYSSIADGSFKNLFIGDYWTIGGVNYRIAGFDYYYRCGDVDFTKHHVVLVPDTHLYTHNMNDTDTTEGGYVGSKMYKEGLEQAKKTIKEAFSGHVATHRNCFTNAVLNGRPSFGAWFDSEVALMNENMLYGGRQFSPMNDGTNIPYNYTVERGQLPLFHLAPNFIHANRDKWYWLRDVVSANYFARVDDFGIPYYGGANAVGGVRPAFCIS